MTIAIDLTSLSYHLSGIERYALCITIELLKYDKSNNYILIFREKIYSEFCDYIDNTRISAKVLHGKNKLIFNQIILPYHLYHIKADKYLFLAFANPILFKKKGIISILHDMGAFDFSKKKGRRAYIREVFAGISMGQNTREDVKVTAKDKLVTLSTCTSDQADGRYLVQAVLRKKEKTRR